MKILFVNPRFPKSLWGFQGIADIVGVQSGQAPLGLVTVAGITPPEFDVELRDENCYPLSFETDADVVAIGCWNVQYHRALEIAVEFKRRGKFVVVGGPYPSLCPERFVGGPFDAVFEGEAERTWQQFCADLVAGTPKSHYRQPGNVDIRISPIPRFDLLGPRDYLYYFIQTTRGCPFQCEFCDIIITDGRIPRTKSVEQVLEEVRTIAALGGKYVSFSDANFIGNMRYAEELCDALAVWGRENGYPLTFSAEMTITVAEKEQLLQKLRAANFTSIFVGVESPRVDSLVETKKRQNVHRPLIDSIRKIQSHNLVVVAGMIVGFDHDDVRIFQEQFDFLMEAGIAFTTCGVLTALEKTPLHARLQKEGRLLPYDSTTQLGHGSADLNFVPKAMSASELLQGYNWLIRALYRYDNYGSRVATAFRHFTPENDASGHAGSRVDWSFVPIVLRVLGHFLVTRSATRRRFFLRTLREVMAEGLSFEKLLGAVSYMIAHKHFHEYVTATHGDPEQVSNTSPFTDPAIVDAWWRDEARSEFARRLKREVYRAAHWVRLFARPRRRAVAVPEVLLTDRVGQCLRRYLNELGVEVIPVATAALSRLRDRADVIVVPITGTVRRGREELSQITQQVQERMRVDLDRFPRVISFSLDGDYRAMLDAFARIGLTFQWRAEALRRAFETAVDSVMTGRQVLAKT
jgi:radical SAM superfamily enzyme YgiQ (UPF0313 family)